MVAWIRLPPLRLPDKGAIVDEPWSVSLQAVQTANFPHRWNGVSWYTQIPSNLVSRHVVCHEPEHGTSALGLQRVLGSGSYNTAWTWLHKLRHAMVRPGRNKLTGVTEVDETYVGGVGSSRRGRGAERKSVVAIAAEVRGRGPGRIRMSVIQDVSATSLHDFVLNHIEHGAQVHTDGWRGYYESKTWGTNTS